MNNMKKVLVFLMILCLALSGAFTGYDQIAAASLFSDVPEGSWYFKDLEYVVKDPRQIIVGSGSKFGPLDDLTVEQFLKVATRAAGFNPPAPQAGERWSLAYMQKAVEMNLVLSGEFSSYTRGITRAEMARIIMRVLPHVTGESSVSYDLNAIKAKISDFDSIPANLRDYVCQAYQLGILTGGSGNRFNPNGCLQRASAASVIRRVIDKSARMSPPASGQESDMWTDAEFEAFLKSEDIEKYANVYAIQRIENRKIYWKSDKNPSGVLIPEKNNPGVNDMAYNLIKIVAYHTKKNDGFMLAGYTDKIMDAFVVKFYVYKSSYHYQPEGDIVLYIYSNPAKCYTAKRYFPGKQQGDTHYQWGLGCLHKDSDMAEYIKKRDDRRKYDWTMPRYEFIFKEMCAEVYGKQQGQAFYNFALHELDESFFDVKYKSSFIGVKPEVGCEIVYQYPEENDAVFGMQFSTDRPEVRK